MTPAPIFHTTPASLVVGLKASHPPPPAHFNLAASSFQVSRDWWSSGHVTQH